MNEWIWMNMVDNLLAKVLTEGWYHVPSRLENRVDDAFCCLFGIVYFFFLVADTQLYKRLFPSIGPLVRWSVGPAVHDDRVWKCENAHFRPCPPVRNWYWPCTRPCFRNVPWFLLCFTFINVRATFERQTKMSRLRPILGRIDLRYVALEVEKCAQSCLSCPMPDEIGDEWGFQIYCHTYHGI